MRASRLLSILLALQLHGRLSADALAARLEVSKRTIYRDIDELSAAGVPVYAERGAGGGFCLHGGWRTRLTGFTPAEAASVLFASMPDTAAELGMAESAAAARLKLLAAMPGALGETAQRIGDRFHLDPSPWHRRAATPQTDLRILAQAVWETRRIRLRYESWTRETKVTLEPLGLVLKAGEWYFVALRRGRPAIHKLSNARELELLPHTFERPERFDLAAAWSKTAEAFETGLRRTKARLRVHERALSRLESLGADISEPVLAAHSDTQGWRAATVWIESVPYAAGLILGFGADIVVRSPAALRAELWRRARDVAELYSERGAT